MGAIGSLYSGLASEVARLKAMDEAQEDSLDHYEQRVRQVIREKNELIKKLSEELKKNGTSPGAIY